MNTNHVELKYGDHTFTEDSLPANSIAALLSRGLTHYLGNEQSSKVTSWAKKDENKGATDEDKAEMLANFQDKAIAALNAGTIGNRIGGTKKKGLEWHIHDVTVARIAAFFAAKGKKMPSGKGAAEAIRGLVTKWLSDAGRAKAVKEAAQAQFESAQSGADEDVDFDE